MAKWLVKGVRWSVAQSNTNHLSGKRIVPVFIKEMHSLSKNTII